jgi:hypothetical protein
MGSFVKQCESWRMTDRLSLTNALADTSIDHELRRLLTSFDFIHNLNGHAIFIRTRMPQTGGAFKDQELYR